MTEEIQNDTQEQEAVPDREQKQDEGTQEAVDIEIEDGDSDTGEDGSEETADEKLPGEDSEEEDETEPGDEEGESGDSPQAEQEADAKDGKGSKGFFKKKKDKRDEQIADLTEKFKRQMAEFDNFRKRSEREKSQMFDMGARNVIEKILPVIDNFERGLGAVPEEQKEDGFVSGMDMIYKQLMTELENLGVKPIECVGREFDPEFHNAVMQVESEEFESGVVAQELQRGYTYKDTVVRHSMVAVVQ